MSFDGFDNNHHSGDLSNEHTHLTFNHNHHGGLSSVTTYLPTGEAVHQGLTSNDTHVHYTDGHNKVLFSTTNHHNQEFNTVTCNDDHREPYSFEQNGLNNGDNSELLNNHYNTYNSASNLSHIQASSDPLAYAADTKFPPFKL